MLLLKVCLFWQTGQVPARASLSCQVRLGWALSADEALTVALVRVFGCSCSEPFRGLESLAGYWMFAVST